MKERSNTINIININSFGACSALVVNGIFIVEVDSNSSFEESHLFDTICQNVALALGVTTPLTQTDFTPKDSDWNWDEVLKDLTTLANKVEESLIISTNKPSCYEVTDYMTYQPAGFKRTKDMCLVTIKTVHACIDNFKPLSADNLDAIPFHHNYDKEVYLIGVKEKDSEIFSIYKAYI